MPELRRSSQQNRRVSKMQENGSDVQAERVFEGHLTSLPQMWYLQRKYKNYRTFISTGSTSALIVMSLQAPALGKVIMSSAARKLCSIFNTDAQEICFALCKELSVTSGVCLEQNALYCV